jgi:hypothetical protein
MDRFDEAVPMRVTLTLLVGGFSLIVPGALGVGSSLPLVVAVVSLSGLLFVWRERLAETVARVDPHGMAETLWIAPLLAGLVAVVWLGATPGELQTLGGVLGLLGMANYFLRPVYHLLDDVVGRLAD